MKNSLSGRPLLQPESAEENQRGCPRARSNNKKLNTNPGTDFGQLGRTVCREATAERDREL